MLGDVTLLCYDKFIKKLDFDLKLWKVLKQSANKCIENWRVILYKTFLCHDSKIKKWKMSGILHITNNICQYISQATFSLLSNVLVLWKRPQPVWCGEKITLWNTTNMADFGVLHFKEMFVQQLLWSLSSEYASFHQNGVKNKLFLCKKYPFSGTR